jgi:murein DD-endopeptidase MepM/ murein hydrolase activator NlpD
MKKKRQRRISVLLIPDDNAEPFNFRLSWALAKVLIGIGLVFALHIIFGGLAYWKYFQLSAENGELERSNSRLLDDNKRVYELQAQLEGMSKEQAKILSLLGVDPQANGAGSLGAASTPSPPVIADRVEPQSAPAVNHELAKEVNLTPAGGFLIRRRTDQLMYAANMPTLLPVEGFLTTEFSESKWTPPLFRSHPGIDIAAKSGSVVLAAGEGQVIFANWTHDLGNQIIIHHGDNVFSCYGHNERLLAHDKMYVKKGEPIALLGNSGKSSGPHLHFEIWKDGAAIDPRQILLAFRAISK